MQSVRSPERNQLDPAPAVKITFESTDFIQNSQPRFTVQIDKLVPSGTSQLSTETILDFKNRLFIASYDILNGNSLGTEIKWEENQGVFEAHCRICLEKPGLYTVIAKFDGLNIEQTPFHVYIFSFFRFFLKLQI